MIRSEKLLFHATVNSEEPGFVGRDRASEVTPRAALPAAFFIANRTRGSLFVGWVMPVMTFGSPKRVIGASPRCFVPERWRRHG